MREAGTSPDSYAGNLGYHVGDDPDNVDLWRGRLQDETGPLSWMSQVHGTTLVDAAPHVQEADGLLLGPGQGGAVMVADCVPLLLLGTGPVTRGAVVHVGRKGLLGGIATKAVHALRSAGATDVRAVIGPSICGSCYEVGEEVAAEAEKDLPGSASTTSWGTPSIDIPGTLVRLLEAEGVDVDLVEACTMEDERFFSHRRQKGRAGRFAGVLVLPG